jgi:REP element-mobilizing transposase RayT
VELEKFAIMPNHFHATLTLNDDDKSTARRAHTMNERFGVPVSGSIPTIVRAFKAAVTKRVNELRNMSGMVVWHKNYYEHVICTEREYINIDAYIESNPIDWTDQRKPWLS